VVTPSAGDVVLVRFPFSDLSEAKLRPALVLAGAGRNDWILCQITSNPYGDQNAVPLSRKDFESGSLRIRSYARPAKLFTASRDLMIQEVGRVRRAAFSQVVNKIVLLLQTSERECGS
jgi:mRNA interferase MazF